MSNANRIEWLDAAKGISILLVVFGHVFPPPIGSSVELIRMPLFFFLAGYTFKDRPWPEFLWKRGNSLLVPYLWYLFLITALAVLWHVGRGTFEIPAASEFRWAAAGGSRLEGVYGQLWFLTTLFAALAMMQLLLKLTPSLLSLQSFTFVGVALAIGYALGGVQTFFALGVAPVALAFLYAGRAYREVTMPGWLISLSLVVMLAAPFFTSVSFKHASFGTPVLTLAACLASCYAAVRICEFLSRYRMFVRVFAPIGGGSLAIMALHQTVAIRLAELGWPPIAIYPFAVIVPFALVLALRNASWVPQLLFLGRPPEKDHIAAAKQARTA